MSDEDKTVPLDQLIKEREKVRAEAESRKGVEKERDDLKQRIDALEAKDKTEVEKLTQKVTALEKTNGDLQATNDKLVKDGEHVAKRQLISDAALEANFHNPRAAAALLDGETFTSVDSKDAAKKAVAALAKSDTYLVREPAKDDTGASLIQKVLDGGKPVGPDSKNGGQPDAPEPGLPTLRQAYAEKAQQT